MSGTVLMRWKERRREMILKGCVRMDRKLGSRKKEKRRREFRKDVNERVEGMEKERNLDDTYNKRWKGIRK